MFRTCGALGILLNPWRVLNEEVSCELAVVAELETRSASYTDQVLLAAVTASEGASYVGDSSAHGSAGGCLRDSIRSVFMVATRSHSSNLGGTARAMNSAPGCRPWSGP